MIRGCFLRRPAYDAITLQAIFFGKARVLVNRVFGELPFLFDTTGELQVF